mmetsp:Transcript_22100/g.58909  ORF Transcript_22100/g.58909 Transcript_22100/m.58909 type:complete len:260 (+) Transcript_22100:251-1030(+)
MRPGPSRGAKHVRKHKLSEVRADSLEWRWTRLQGAPGACQGAAPETPPFWMQRRPVKPTRTSERRESVVGAGYCLLRTRPPRPLVARLGHIGVVGDPGERPGLVEPEAYQARQQDGASCPGGCARVALRTAPARAPPAPGAGAGGVAALRRVRRGARAQLPRRVRVLLAGDLREEVRARDVGGALAVEVHLLAVAAAAGPRCPRALGARRPIRGGSGLQLLRGAEPGQQQALQGGGAVWIFGQVGPAGRARPKGPLPPR